MASGPAALELGIPAHSTSFRSRRFLNWFPLGVTYALLYMGRYNLNVAKNALGALMTNEDFGLVFAAGTVVYGIAFILNGPLTDRIGGKRAMLISALGAASMNLLMGLYLQSVVGRGTVSGASLRFWFTVLYAGNMYFQSFGAVAIVKVNAYWFHVRERGGFSGIFGTMIASGIFLAFTLNAWILDFVKAHSSAQSEVLQTRWVFFAPAALLFAIFALELFLLRDRPSQAGHRDFDTGDATSGEGELPIKRVLAHILTHPILITIALIEFCTGLVRQGVMQWYPFYAKSMLVLPAHHYLRDGSWGRWWTIVPFFLLGAIFLILARRSAGSRRGGLSIVGALLCLAPFMQAGWGGLLFVAGVIGANVAGYVSDLFFQSRRSPVAGILYAVVFLGTIAMVFARSEGTTTVESSSEPGLLPGDRVVSVAGVDNFRNWNDVSEAFAGVPAACLGDAQWDLKRHMCSARPDMAGPRSLVSPGLIEVQVERDHKPLLLRLRDPSPKLRAGDRRVLRATPQLTLSPYWLGAVVFLISLCVIGTHGLLSGTATMDFGGSKGAATAVGLIDGCVYLGTAVQSVGLGYLTEISWSYWPWFLMPFAVAGFLLCTRIWHAKPAPKSRH